MASEIQPLKRIEKNSNEWRNLKGSLYPEKWDARLKKMVPGCTDEEFEQLLDRHFDAKITPYAEAFYIIHYGKKGEILPGINYYRIIASRTNCYVGLSEPEFGPEIEHSFHKYDADGKVESSKTFRFPEWCKIVVSKVVNGQVGLFFTKEYWLENYAPISKTNEFPNSMWQGRPRGQLAKCCEAQSLRKAFPEEIGITPTFEEMEGKDISNIKTAAPFLGEEVPEIAEVNDDEFCLDGKIVEREYVKMTVLQLIDSVKDQSGLEMLENWKNDNMLELKRFFSKNKIDAQEIRQRSDEAKQLFGGSQQKAVANDG